MQRRSFLKTSGKAAGVAAAATMVPGIASCSTRVNTVKVGLIGCRGMGFTNLKTIAKIDNVEVVALCDVDQKVLEIRAKDTEKLTGKKPLTYTDFRDLLKNRKINTVIIATPDHWHAHMLTLALEAKKHVYVEKPMGHSIGENWHMQKEAKKHRRYKVQVGMWQRSAPHWPEAIQKVREGYIGEVNLVRAFIYKGYVKPFKLEEDSETPSHVDYDMWLGPAQNRPYNRNRFHYNFRWFWDYGGGAMTDWGVHLIDFALLGMNAGMPKSISPGGGVFGSKGIIETPDIQQAIYNYDNFSLIWECGLMPGNSVLGKESSHGVAFHGTKGTLWLSRSGWSVIPEYKKGIGNLIEPIPNSKKQGGLEPHMRNFVNAIRLGDDLNCNVDEGAKVAIVSEMGNIAFRVGQTLHWDDSIRRFDNEKANQLIHLKYRNKWPLG